MITGVILARNEESNIVDCLNALLPHVSEVVLIDMESEDQTVELARPYVNRILSHPKVANFDVARNIAIPVASNEWLWFVDADERISAVTGQLVNQLVREQGQDFEALTIPFKTYFCGKWMRHCGWWPGYTMPRVLKRGFFSFDERLHGGVGIEGRQVRIPPDPSLGIDHFSYLSIEHYLDKLNRYTSTEAKQLVDKGAKWDWRQALDEMVRDLWVYYEANPGRLDGVHGWVLSWLSGQYRFISHAKLLDFKRNEDDAASVPSNLDEMLQQMELSLAGARKLRPKLPLGIVWRSPIWDSSGYADEGRTFVKALSEGTRPVTLDDIRWSESECELPESDRQLFRALSRARRAPYVAMIADSIPITCRTDPAACINIIRTTFETDRIPAYWLPHLEQFDEVWVISEHNRRAFCRSGVPAEKIRIVPSCLDTNLFTPAGVQTQIPAELEGTFVFLSIFDWGLRKGWDLLLQAFCQEFGREEGAGLLLKISRSHGHSMETVVRQANDVLSTIKQSLADRPDIVITDRIMSSVEIAALYRTVDAFVLPTRGEGWGRPYMEAMASGLPTIGTAASGNVDFMNSSNSLLVSAIEVDVPEAGATEIPIYRGHRWFEPSIDELRRAMRQVFGDERLRRQIGERAATDIRAQFNLKAGRKAIEGALASAELSLVPVEIRPISESQVSVEWEGEFFARHSFSNVNEQIVERLIEDLSIAISIRRLQSSPTFDLQFNRRNRLTPYFNRQIDRPVDVTIRHSFPPNWQVPITGRWVHIQPWEFGRLPADWIPPLRDRVDEIWAPSNYVRQVYVDSGIPSDKIRVIPWGVDSQVLNPEAPPFHLPAKQFRFLFVGGTIERKGIDILLRAYTEEFSSSESVSLVIKDIGTRSFYRDATYRDRILQMASESINPHILYSEKELTNCQMASLYTACDCLVAPYRGEGFGLPILEALACGRPVIVPHGGPTDDYVSTDCAYLVPADRVVETYRPDLGTTPIHLEVKVADLRKAMRRAFAEREAMRRMGRIGSEIAHQKYTWDMCVTRMIDRIRQLARNGEPSDRHITVPSLLDQSSASCSLSVVVFHNGPIGLLVDTLARIRPCVSSIIVYDRGHDPRATMVVKEYSASYVFPGSAIASPQVVHLTGPTWLLYLESGEQVSERELELLPAWLAKIEPIVTRIAVSISEDSPVRGLAKSVGRHRLICADRVDTAIQATDIVALLNNDIGTDDRGSNSDQLLAPITVTVARQVALCDSDESVSGSPNEVNDNHLRASNHHSQAVTPSAPSPGPPVYGQLDKSLLIQMATGPHVEFLKLTENHHREYAERHALDYWCVFGNPTRGKRSSWGKVPLLLNAIRLGYKRVIWMDADAVIVRPDLNIADACSDGIAMVRHPRPDHWNCGLIVTCASDAIEKFWACVDATPENNDPWMEQLVVNRLSVLPEFVNLFHELDIAFNSIPGHIAADRPIVIAGHSLPLDRRKEILREGLEQAKNPDPMVSADGLNSREDFGVLLNSKRLLGEAVEIGVFRGEFSRVVLDKWQGRLLHLVDPWRHLDDHHDITNLSDVSHEQCLAEVRSNLAKHRSRYRIHRALSKDAVEYFEDNSLDFVYLDANHALDSVRQDLRMWYPKVKPSGIFAGHDFLDGDLPEGRFGVASAVHEFQKETGLAIQLTNDPPWKSWYCVKPTALS